MRSKCVVAAWIAVFLLAGRLPLARGADPEGASPPAKIGTVNVGKVFTNYKKTKDLQHDLNAWTEQKQQVSDEKRNEIAKLKDSIPLLEIGTEERKKQEEDLQKKQIEFQTFQKVTSDTLLSKNKEVTEKLYTEIIKAVADLSREEKFDLIIKVDDTPLNSESLDELLIKIGRRNVVYVAPRLDITDAVLNRLNKGYSKEVIEK